MASQVPFCCLASIFVYVLISSYAPLGRTFLPGTTLLGKVSVFLKET